MNDGITKQCTHKSQWCATERQFDFDKHAFLQYDPRITEYPIHSYALLGQSLTTAYSSEENDIVERANQEVLCHLNAILFDARVHDKWSYEQLPMVILNNSIRLTDIDIAHSGTVLRANRVVRHNG